ncbi:MAG TPA: hypothetical protein VMM18_06940 [Gemmatimonadaceae bacterium]|nr:hypothetical protein [Gemmatimonadaceae bacterium]
MTRAQRDLGDDVPRENSGHARRGVALIVVMIAVVLVGVLIAGAFFGSTQELRIGRAVIEQERALAAAEYSLHEALENLTIGQESDDGGSRLGARPPVEHDGVTTSFSITRLGALSFWIVARAVAQTADAGQATRRLGAFAVVEVPDLTPLAAMTFSGAGPVPEPLEAGVLRVTGSDAAPSGPGACAGVADPIAGVALSDAASFGTSVECPAGSCITGSPPVLQMPELQDPNALGGVGAAVWNELTSGATITLPAGTVIGGGERPLGPHVIDGECDRTIHHNWGDIDRSTPCRDYFPLVHVGGDLMVVGGAGQGILVVDGDLVLSGGVRFSGAVLVRGSLRTSDGGGHVAGAVWVAGLGGNSSSLAGGGTFVYSRCALLSALSRHGTPALLPRSWTEIH